MTRPGWRQTQAPFCREEAALMSMWSTFTGWVAKAMKPAEWGEWDAEGYWRDQLGPKTRHSTPLYLMRTRGIKWIGRRSYVCGSRFRGDRILSNAWLIFEASFFPPLRAIGIPRYIHEQPISSGRVFIRRAHPSTRETAPRSTSIGGPEENMGSRASYAGG
jgi:hypothetical protein